jgi:hypothetical protein
METIELPRFGIVIRINDQGGSIESSELQDERAYPAWQSAIGGLLSLVLAHACAGINVRSQVYLDGIEGALNSLADEYGQ